MNYLPVSACTLTRDAFAGGWCLFESMASLLPFVEELVVMDLGSTDGTLEALREIAEANPKFKIIARPDWPRVDAGVLSDLMNELVEICRYERVLCFGSDEVWHEDLLLRMEDHFEQGKFNLTFWRLQYRDNFQSIKWPAHTVHRVGLKGQLDFVDDAMMTRKRHGAELCSQYGGTTYDHDPQMNDPEGAKSFVHDMIVDVSKAAFLDNAKVKSELLAPFWHESPNVEGKPTDEWLHEARENPDWAQTESPFNLPKLLRWHVGRPRYELRPELLEALKRDETRKLLGI